MQFGRDSGRHRNLPFGAEVWTSGPQVALANQKKAEAARKVFILLFRRPWES